MRQRTTLAIGRGGWVLVTLLGLLGVWLLVGNLRPPATDPAGAPVPTTRPPGTTAIPVGTSAARPSTAPSAPPMPTAVPFDAAAQQACPVTIPNGAVPSGERPAPTFHGRAGIWTNLPISSTVVLPRARDATIISDQTWLWWVQPAEHVLIITGHRRDAPAPALWVSQPVGYQTAVRPARLRFPTRGCWEITATTDQATLTIIVRVVGGIVLTERDRGP